MERLALSDQELAGRQGETRPKARMVILCGELSFWNTGYWDEEETAAVRVAELESYPSKYDRWEERI